MEKMVSNNIDRNIRFIMKFSLVNNIYKCTTELNYSIAAKANSGSIEDAMRI
ncbi:hypothetical protein GCM10027043_43140 [Ferruginibacter profundus]